MAAIGGTRTARRAGLMAEITVTPTPTTSATTTVRASNTSGPDGSVKPNALSSASSPRAASTPRPVPMSEETTPDNGGFPEHRAEDLATAGADDAQHGQLPSPLPDGDGESIEDGKGADEQRDKGEHEQGGGEKRKGLVDGARLLVDHGLAGDDLGPGRQDPGDGPLDRGLVGAWPGDHVDVVELAHLVQHHLRRRKGEGGDRHAGQVVGRPKLDDPGDGEASGSAPRRGCGRAGPR